MKKHFLAIYLLFAAAVLFSACGGGGGGGDSTPQPQPTATYLHYYNRTTGGLFFYDPGTKATTTVEDGTTGKQITGGVRAFVGGAYNAAAKQLTDVHFHTLVYAKGSSLYKVSLLKSGTHTSVRLSNEAGLTTLCSSHDIPDIADPDNSIYAYELPGADGLCTAPTDTDNVWKAVRLSSSPTTTPLEITSLNKKPVTEIRDWSTGGIAGQLAVDLTNEDLVKCTADFTSANCTTILSAPTYTVLDAGSLGVDINTKNMYLWVYNGTEYQVRTYNSVSNIISGPVYTTTNLLAEGFQDGNGIYFAETPHTLKRMTFDPVPDIVSLLTETSVTNAILTDSRIVYVAKQDLSTGTTPTTYWLKSTTLTSSPTTTILAQTASDTEVLELAACTGGGVYYNRISPGFVYTAGYSKDDGAGGRYEVTNARWTATSNFSVMRVPSGKVDLAKVVMSKQNIVAGVDVLSFDPATYSSTSTGLLLGNLSASEFYGGGIGNDILGVNFGSGPGDIFTVNVNVGNSLYRVTNTADDETLWP